MLELNVINKLDNNNVLISEQKKYSKNQPTRYYIAQEDKADKFMKTRKSLSMINKFQKSLSGGLAVGVGVLAGCAMKYGGKIGKVAAGITAGIATLGATLKLDQLVDNQAQKNNMKRLHVEEITQDEERVQEALNFNPENQESEETITDEQ